MYLAEDGKQTSNTLVRAFVCIFVDGRLRVKLRIKEDELK